MTFFSPEMAAEPCQQPRYDLSLDFELAQDGRTFIGRQFGRYPFHVCRAHYVDTVPVGMATVYLQSSAGGIFADDRLSSRLSVAPGASAHVTSQASTIVHRMDRGEAWYTVTIEAAGDAMLEYLPDPMILFPKVRLNSSVLVRKSTSATVILTDAFMTHDPADGGDGGFSEVRNEIRVEDLDGMLLAVDRSRFTGEEFSGSKIGSMGDNRVLGTFMVLSPQCESNGLPGKLRGVLGKHQNVFGGVSSMPNDAGVWVRLAATEVLALRTAMHQLWRGARKALCGRFPHERKK